MLDPLQTLATGLVLGFSVAAPPGPVNAAAAYEVATRSWAAGLLTVLGATTADAVFFTGTYYGLTGVVGSGAFREALFLAGGALMTYLAVVTLNRARGAPPAAERGAKKLPYLKGLSIGLTNPYQLAWWVTAGVGMVANFGLRVLAGFFGGILVWDFTYTVLLRSGVTKFARAYQAIALVSGAVLLAFGAWFILVAASSIL